MNCIGNMSVLINNYIIMSKIPREFRLLDELDNSSAVAGVSYGLEDASDNDFVNWTGSLMTNTGHFVGFTFVCKPDYPTSRPVIQFNKEYITQTKKDYDDEMGTYVEKVNSLCTSGTSNLSDTILTWNDSKTIGSYLKELHKKIFGSNA